MFLNISLCKNNKQIKCKILNKMQCYLIRTEQHNENFTATALNCQIDNNSESWHSNNIHACKMVLGIGMFPPGDHFCSLLHYITAKLLHSSFIP